MSNKLDLCADRTEGRPLGPSFFDAEPVKRGRVRASRMGRRRAWVLLLVHLAIFAHILHWKLAGETVSPLEPSEAMYTVATGAINAGAILLLGSLLATLILGRWFCGWACHVVALQDLSAWVLKKLGIRPEPLRSRWLMWVPLLAGLYLFGWPWFLRLLNGAEEPALHAAYTKVDFWETFPGFWIGALTFVTCGGVMVYLLGAKGFCTYACPYGGLFGVVDRLSPARIRVTDACKGCGHCSAVCTSNVRVASEVHAFGMVVDPGCMKCLDCVSVCPEGALYYGFGRPALFAKSRLKHPRKLVAGFRWWEEILMVLVFAVTLFVMRGLPHLPDTELVWIFDQSHLYGRIPLLFALGLSGVAAFSVAFIVRLWRRTEVRFLGATLKHGKLTGLGRMALGLALAYVGFVLHSGAVQYNMWQGARYLEMTGPAGQAPWAQDRATLTALPAGVLEAARVSEEYYARAKKWSLVKDPRIGQQRMWLALVRGEVSDAERHIREALDAEPEWGVSQRGLGKILLLKGDRAGAETAFREAIRLQPEQLTAYTELADLLLGLGRTEDALLVLESHQRHDPGNYVVGAVRIACLAELGRPTDKAVAELKARLAKAHPDVDPRLQVGPLLVQRGAPELGVAELRDALREFPEDPVVLRLLAEQLLLVQKPPDEPLELLQRAKEIDPDDLAVRLLLAETWLRAEKPQRAEEEAQFVWSRGETALAAFTVSRALQAQGKHAEARQWFEKAKVLGQQ